MTLKVKQLAALAMTAPVAPQALQVAYHQGPPEISFAGRIWRLGDAQSVTDYEWTAMGCRADFYQFDYKPTPAAAPAPDLTEE